MAELMVGGAFLSAFLNVSFDRLATQQVVDFFREKNLDENLFKRLKISLMTVSVVLDDAETKEVTHPLVKEWMEELKDTIYHAEDVLDEIVTLASKPEKSIFNTSLFEFSDKNFDVKRVEDIVFKMELLASQKEHLGLRELVGDNSKQGVPATSLVESSHVYGRDNDKQQIIESVLMDVALKDQIPVITIVGMGGIGKSTLAKMVYNDEKVDEYFHVKSWVSVGQEFDIFPITKIILETVTLNHSSGIKDLNLLQLKLKEMLTGKKTLLVLDDVWNEDYSKWCELRAPFISVASGSKIIVTTRNKGVASIMCNGMNPHSIKHLSDEDGGKLFAHHAFETTNGGSHPQLEEIGKQIVKKCKGLPLAIKSLSGVLRNRYDLKVWENVLKSEFWDLQIGKTGILTALRLSYHYLPTHLKRCFAYCSIFPQDYEFEKEKLVLLWMAEGFVKDNTNKSMEEVGEEYFDELFSRSFFQKSSSSLGTFFVMHDLNHDLATHVSGKFCLTSERSKTPESSEKVRHFSYSQGNFDDDHKLGPIRNAKYLRTFLPVKTPYIYNPCLSISIIRDLLLKLSCIRVLSLSSYPNFDELPDSICTLMHLRYLDLSRTSIKSLPDRICELHNLQTLLLSYCRRLIKLPTNLGELVNLRHLDVSGISINKLPPRIRRLESLQTLSSFVVGEDNCSGIGELNGLRHLKGSLSITGLHNVNNAEVIEVNLNEKMGIEQLSLAWGSGNIVTNNHNIMLDKLQPSEKLTHLTLVDYGGTLLSNWLGNGSLFNLTYLKISNCVHCLSLSSLGQLPSLVELYIESMMSVRRVDSDFYGNDPSLVKPFQKLAILKFESMLEWEEWSPSGGVDNDDFPKLRTLWIRGCPKLCGNLPKLLPLLGDLRIEDCDKLIKFSSSGLRTPILNSIDISNCKNLELFAIEDEDGESLKTLQSLRIGGCHKLIKFPSRGLRTPNLQSLHISNCKNLESFAIEDEDGESLEFLEYLGIKDCDKLIKFPSGGLPTPNLKFLCISNCKNLELFAIEDEDGESLKSLQSLTIENCDKLIKFLSVYMRTPNLKSLKLWKCDKLIKFPSGGLRTPNLQSLELWKCTNLKSLPEQMNTQLPSLEDLRIFDCEEVESFPAGGLPSNLQRLSIRGCKKLMAKRREWDLHTLSSLYDLQIVECEEIETFPEAEWQLPASITCLFIEELPNLKRIYASRLPNLEILDIWNCPKVEFNSKFEDNLPASFIKLDIMKCPLMSKQLQSMNRDLIPHLTIEDDSDIDSSSDSSSD